MLYYSGYGHVEILARAVAEGAGGVSGVQVAVKRVPEPAPEELAKQSGMKLDQTAPTVSPEEPAGFDAIIFGTPARFGNMAGPVRSFGEQTGGLWMNGSLVGKVSSVFVSTAAQHGGQEATITSFHTTLPHYDMVIVGVPYSCPALMNTGEISGGTPYGASTPAGADGSRQPSENELEIAPVQGRHVAEITGRLSA